jgi:hypothetical protein
LKQAELERFHVGPDRCREVAAISLPEGLSQAALRIERRVGRDDALWRKLEKVMEKFRISVCQA